jgi:hypothetical protein
VNYAQPATGGWEAGSKAKEALHKRTSGTDTVKCRGKQAKLKVRVNNTYVQSGVSRRLCAAVGYVGPYVLLYVLLSQKKFCSAGAQTLPTSWLGDGLFIFLRIFQNRTLRRTQVDPRTKLIARHCALQRVCCAFEIT